MNIDRCTPKTSTVSPRPLAGNQRSSTAKNRISIRPIQKFGSEKPRIEVVMIERPTIESGFRPAMTPSGTPMPIENTKATNASSIVAGKRSRMTFSADCE